MAKILLVKTSSMGDVIHNLPVVADVKRYCPGAAVDWVVEESFADIPALHPDVREVIPVATRRWRRRPFQRDTLREFREFKKCLRADRYDYVLDTQGLVKSALISRIARGQRFGHSARSARESWSARFYDSTFDVPAKMHAVERNRLLASLALRAMPQSNSVDYGIVAKPLSPDQRYAVLLHATSRPDKQWEDASWVALGQALNSLDFEVLLPWGSEREHSLSKELSKQMLHAFVPARMPVARVARLLAGAAIVVGTDTGLTHLAAALGRPTIGIYCSSDPALTGLYGGRCALNVGDSGRPPSAREVIAAAEKLLV
jgi:heptosyltransferase-1